MFELTNKTTLRLDHVQTRMERHGEDHVPAIDLSLTWTTNNRALDMLHPELRKALYAPLQAPGQDEPEQAEMDLPVDELPVVRFSRIKYPIKLDNEQTGMTVRIDYGLGGASDIELNTCKLSKFAVTPIEGGSVEIKMLLQCSSEIDEHVSGSLSMLQQSEIVLTMLPPLVDDVIDGSQAAFEAETQQSATDAFVEAHGETA